MSLVRNIYRALLFLAALWALVVVGVSLLDAPIFFYPMQTTTDGPAPHRFEVLRLSLFVLFAYFSFLHLFAKDKKLSAGHVLITMMTSLTFIGCAVILSRNRFFEDLGYIAVFGLATIAIYVASRPRVRKYFNQR